MKSLLLLALGLARTVVLGARIEAERIVVSVRPYKREQRRCPVCGRACDFVFRQVKIDKYVCRISTPSC